MNAILMLLVLAAASIFALGGCSSDDGVTPHEDPELTAEDAAYQGAAVTMALVRVLMEIDAKSEGELIEVNQEHVYGSYWNDSEANHVWTQGSTVLFVDFDGLPHDPDFDSPVTFDITETDGVANDSGTVDFPPLVTFTIAAVVLDPGNYPIGGQMIVDTTGHTATIQFFAGHTATVTVDGEVWDVNMDTGDITPA